MTFSFGKNQRGQSLIEILIASTVAAILIGGVVSVVIVALRNSQRARQRAFAQSLIQDMSSGVRSIGASDWHSLFSSSKGELYLNFDEGDDDRVFDPIKGNHGTINLGTGGNTSLSNAWQSESNCKAGRCFSFDGSDDRVTLAPPLTNFPTTAITVAAWVYLTAHVDWNDLAYNNWATATGTWNLFSDAISTAIFGVYSSSTQYNAWGCRAAFTLNAWHFLVGTYDGTTVKMYLDGTQCEGTAVISGVTLYTGGDVLIGEAGSAGAATHRIDEVRVYGRALSQSEIEALYYGVNKLYPDNTSGVWQMKEGTSTVTGGNTTYTKYLAYSNVRRSTSTSDIVSYPAGADDPATKKATYLVTWPPGLEAKTEEYITQSANTGVFLQTDWTGGLATPTDIFFQNITKYETSTNIDATGTSGSIKLKTQ